MKHFLLIGLLVGLPAVASAQVKGSDIVLQLHHLHTTPSMAELEAQSPDARSVVTQTARKARGIGQIRAIHVLASTRDDAAFEVLTRLFDDAKTEEATRHELLGALVTNFGDRAMDRAAAWLRDEDLQRRLTAIDALGRVDTDAAIALLEARMADAKLALEREAIERAAMSAR